MKKIFQFLLIVLVPLKIGAQFGPPQFISNAGGSEIYTVDIDKDGDNDILKVGTRTTWHENEDGQGSFGPEQIITTESGWGAAYYGDLDGDADIDIITILDDMIMGDDYKNIAWFENLDGAGNFGAQHFVANSVLLIGRTVVTADFDGDDDLDVLSGSHTNLFWYENTDGLGNFVPKKIITTNVAIVREVFAADLDNDGDIDVLASSLQDDKLIWHENMDGLGNFGPQHIIATNLGEVWSIFAADLNSDGSTDVLTGAWNSGEIAWFENLNGLGNFGTKQIINPNAMGTTKVYAEDIDLDGDMDVLSASLRPASQGKNVWYENLSGEGNFSDEKIISESEITGMSLITGDLDGDLDADVAAVSVNGLEWFENLHTLSIPENILSNISIAPNPVQKNLYLTYPEQIEISSIVVYDVVGRKIISKPFTTDYINLSELTKGIYTIKFITNFGSITKKIIKN